MISAKKKEDIARIIQILSNFYRSPNQYGGNGMYNGWAQGKFTNGEGYRIFPRFGNFTLEITNGDRFNRAISGEDQAMIELPDVWLRYASEMLEEYCITYNCEVINETENI